LLYNGMLASAGEQLTLIAAKMRDARLHSEACPGVRHFTEGDWKELDDLAPKQPDIPVSALQ
jgi:hypothetical protein